MNTSQKKLSHNQFRKELVKRLPNFLKDTDIIDVQEEFIKSDNNTLKSGVALIKENGEHCVIVTSNIYEVYLEDKHSGMNEINDFCKILADKYKEEISISITNFQNNMSTDIGDRLCCIMLNTESNKEILESRIYEERGPFALILSQFASDDNGNIVIATLPRECVDKHSELKNMGEHELIEKAIFNTAKTFGATAINIHEITAHTIVQDMVESGTLPPIPHLCKMAYDLTYKNISKNSPMGFIVSNNNPYGAIALFYPNLLKDLAKRMNTDKLTIVPASTDEVVVYAGMHEDMNHLNEAIKEVVENALNPEKTILNKAFIYDAKIGDFIF